MDARRWDMLNELFQAAHGLNRDGRQAFIGEACGTDVELCRELHRLLDYHDRTTDARFDTPISILDLTHDAASISDPMIGTRIGNFRIERLLGQGGFGDVYLATRTAEFAQKVAIKVLHAVYRVNATIMRRFEVERQLLADLNHEHIAKLFDGGTNEDGCPYIVMEYVSGQNIMSFCKTLKLNSRQRLELMLQAISGVAYAHQHGVIHRDIKPANILVDRHHRAKLVDFGIAKLTDLRSQAEILTLTRQGLLPLTPQYASPEQFTCERVSPASDVYSLGVVLYELITGRLPYDLPESEIGTLVAVISTQAPLTPTEQLKRNRIKLAAARLPVDSADSAVRAKTRTQRVVDGLTPDLAPADLDNIVLMALRKEPERRYADAGALGDDLRRLLAGEAVLARGDFVAYKVRRFVKKNHGMLWAAGLMVLSLTIGGLAAAIAWRSMLAERQLSMQSQTIARQHAHAAQFEQAFNAFQRNDYRSVREILRRVGHDVIRRSFAFRLLDGLTEPNAAMRLSHRAGSVNEIAVVPGKPWMVTVGEDCQILLWNTTTGELVKKLGNSKGPLYSVAVSADGSLLAVGREELHNAKTDIQLWDMTTFEFLRVVHRCWHVPESLAFSPDGKRLAIGTRYHEIFLVDLESDDKQVAAEDKNARYWNLGFLPDGHLIAPVQEKLVDGSKLEYLGVLDGHLKEVDRFIPRLGHQLAPVSIFALSNSGNFLAATNHYDAALTVYDAQTRYQLASVPTRGDRASAVAISPDDSYVAVGFFDGTVRVWELVLSADRDGKLVGTLTPCFHFQADKAGVRSLQFTEQMQLVTSGSEPVVAIWPTPHGPVIQHIGPPVAGSVGQLAISQNETVALAENGENIWVRHHAGEGLQLAGTDGQPRDSLSISPTGSLLALRIGNQLCTINVDSQQQQVVPFPCEENICGTAISTDGTMLAAISRDRLMSVFDLSSHREIISLKLAGIPSCVTFSVDNKFTACGQSSGDVVLLQLKTGSSHRLNTTASAVTTLVLSHDGNLLAAGHQNGEIWLHRIDGKCDPVLLSGHDAAVTGLLFSHDHQTMLSSGGVDSVRVWQVSTMRLLGNLYEGHPIAGMQFSVDGDRLFLDFAHTKGNKAVWMLQL